MVLIRFPLWEVRAISRVQSHNDVTASVTLTRIVHVYVAQKQLEGVYN